MQGPVLQHRLGGKGLQHRPGHDLAVGNTEAVAKLERGAADNDLPALQLCQGCGIATQYVNKGDRRHGTGANAEVDQERR